jgi:hypothetical protein
MSDASALPVSPERTTYQQHLVNLFIQSKACEKYLLVSALGEGRGAHVEKAVPKRTERADEETRQNRKVVERYAVHWRTPRHFIVGRESQPREQTRFAVI